LTVFKLTNNELIDAMDFAISILILQLVLKKVTHFKDRLINGLCFATLLTHAVDNFTLLSPSVLPKSIHALYIVDFLRSITICCG